jgi:hypothetical protein
VLCREISRSFRSIFLQMMCKMSDLESKISIALVWRVNTFYILQTSCMGNMLGIPKWDIPSIQCCFLTPNFFTLRIYVIYKGKFWFHSKNFEFFFLLKTWFLPIKSHETWKKAIIFFRLSRAAAVDRNLCPTYSLDHKT